MKALHCKQLNKQYVSGVKIIEDLELSIEPGEFFGLLGPNGAGKTTLIAMITSLVRPSSGDISIFGHSVIQEPCAKRLMGVVPQEFNFNLFDSVLDILLNQAGYYGIPRDLALQRAVYYLKALDLWDKRFFVARTLSGGMKRRLMIARALIHEPKLLLLDEPTAGVDVTLRRSLWDFLRELNQQGVTIFLTTHYLEEAEILCNRIAVIKMGKIIKNTTVKNLLSDLKKQTIILDLSEPVLEVPMIPGCMVRSIEARTLEITLSKAYDLSSVFELLSQKNMRVLSMRNKVNRLEEALNSLTQGNSEE